MKKEGRGYSRLHSRTSPAACGEDHGGADCPLAAHGGAQGGAGEYVLKEAVAHREHLPKQIPGWTCSLWRGVDAVAGDLAGAATPAESLLQQFAPEKWILWYRPI